MAGWMSKIFSSGLGELAEKVGGVADRFIHSKDEQAQFKLDMETLLQKAGSELEQTMRTELQSKERILVAELTQGDKYTKRARPTVVYGGLVFIAINYVLAPLVGYGFGIEIPTLELPKEFWYGWSGIVATWSVGRSMERRGVANNLVKIVTGTPKSITD